MAGLGAVPPLQEYINSDAELEAKLCSKGLKGRCSFGLRDLQLRTLFHISGRQMIFSSNIRSGGDLLGVVRDMQERGANVQAHPHRQG